VALVLVCLLGGCAYFNTFYSAKKNFNEAERLYASPDDRATPQQIGLYDKALQSATKVVVNYPTSKWVDDAVLLMGRALLGKGEYEKARLKFDELGTNFPESPLRDLAYFYKAEAYRRERLYPEALAVLDTLESAYPKSRMRAQAALRRGQILVGRQDFRAATAELAPLVGHEEDDVFRLSLEQALADAYYGVAAYDTALVHYREVARHSRAEAQVNQATLRQGDCYEGMRDHEAAARLYQQYEQEALRQDYKDQARIRRANALALGGRVPEGRALLEQMATEKGATPTAAEALFKLGFIEEVLLDDLPAARATYEKVVQNFRGSQFAGQAEQRLQNLEKIEALRAEMAADTTGREQAAAAAFAVAERYYYDANRPERAIEEFARVESVYGDTEFGPKAALATAWVLRRSLQRPAAADSALRALADRYPESRYGRAASAYLRGQVDSLRVGEPIAPTPVSFPVTPGAQAYVPPKIDVKALREAREAAARKAAADSARGPAADSAAKRGRAAGRDTSRVAPAPPDTSRVVPAPPDTSRAPATPAPAPTPAPADTTRGPVPAPADTTRPAPAPRDTTDRRQR
jgi:TolA-binding protein